METLIMAAMDTLARNGKRKKDSLSENDTNPDRIQNNNVDPLNHLESEVGQ
jgi:hypothetical protein